ncbi:hypothetical protein B0H14DRAFT_3643453 [Mycena olivaceomarginata]|nr:hypothetical protein B0H14DRAFT_3643453 [Mycena olivaceomarginata]
MNSFSCHLSSRHVSLPNHVPMPHCHPPPPPPSPIPLARTGHSRRSRSRSGSPTGAQQRKREKTRFAPAPVGDGESGSASGASVESTSALPPSSGIQASMHIEDVKEAGKSEPKKEKEEKERERKEERGTEPERERQEEHIPEIVRSVCPLPPQQQICKDEQSSRYGKQLGFLRMETTLRLGPPRLWTGSPLPPRRSLSHGRNTMQVDADMLSPHNAPPSQPNSAAPTPTPASNHPPRQGSAAPICARSGMYSDREGSSGDAFCGRQQCAEGPEGDGHDTDRGLPVTALQVWVRARRAADSRLVVGTDEGGDAIGRRRRIWAATEIEHTREGKGFMDEEEVPHFRFNNVSIGNRQHSASDFRIAGSVGEREARVGDEDKEDPTRVVQCTTETAIDPTMDPILRQVVMDPPR